MNEDKWYGNKKKKKSENMRNEEQITDKKGKN